MAFFEKRGFRLLFEGYQFGGKSVVTNPLARGFVNFLFPSQSIVSDEATATRKAQKLRFLFFVWFQAKPIALSCYHRRL